MPVGVDAGQLWRHVVLSSASLQIPFAENQRVARNDGHDVLQLLHFAV